MQNETQEPQAHSSRVNLPPIPTPVETRWREVRARYVPLIVFSICVIAIWQLWRALPPATGVRGIGEGAVALIASPHDGFLERAKVQPHGWVQKGQPLLTVVPFDPGAQFDIFQSQLQISRLAMEPSVADRNALDYEQLRVDLLGLKTDLATAQANLDRAEKVLPRHEALLKENLISRDIYDLTVRDRDFYQAEVREKTFAIGELERRLQELQAMSQPDNPGVNPQAQELIPRLQEQMASVQTNLNPITLHAPISGEVSFYRRENEFVRAGELIMEINAARADHIVAYLKQPIPFEPELGMTMEVITRSRKPQRFLTEIAHIGARLQVITNALAYVAPGSLVDSGLPLILPVPENVQIRPGEIVEVSWKDSKSKATLSERVFGQ